jgi:CubicO group peptidase (beta-lactamase class C family)
MDFINLTKSLATIIMIIATLTTKAQEVKFPATEAGKIGELYIEAFNAENDDLMRDFILSYRTEESLVKRSVDERMTQFEQVKGMIQLLEVKQINEIDEKQLIVLSYSEQMKTWFELSFLLNNESPIQLEKFGLKPSQAPGTEDVGFGDWNDLNQLLTIARDKYSIPGISMAIISNGEITEDATAGVRSISTNDPIQSTDRFHLGSITKSFTATLVGRLIENNRLTENTSIAEVFPEMKMNDAFKSVTIKQLLDHRGGIQSHTSDNPEIDKKLITLKGNPIEQRLKFTQIALNEEPINEPGSAMAYSNAGYTILAAITEKITNLSWEDQLVKYIFNPLNMNTAGIGWPSSEDRLDQPLGYEGELSNLTVQSPDYKLGSYMAPAGDIHASMSDLAKFVIAHYNGLNGEKGILKTETFKMLHSSKTNQYSSGWILKENDKGNQIHEHSGTAGTFMAHMSLNPETGDGWVMAANAGNFALLGIFHEIINEFQTK